MPGPDFSQQIAEWQTFYATLAASTATLVGLLFFALALNVDFLTRAENAHAKALARHTLRSFLNIFVTSMLFLVPRETALVLGIGLLVIGAMGEWDLVTYVRAVRASGHRDRVLNARLAFVSVCHVGLAFYGFELIRNQTIPLVWLVSLVLALVVSAVRNCWHLIMEVRLPSATRAQTSGEAQASSRES